MHTLQAPSIREAELEAHRRGLAATGPIICIWQSDRMGQPRVNHGVGIEFVDITGRDFTMRTD